MRPYPLFSRSSFFTRQIFAFILVFGLYNPSGRAYVEWLMTGDANLLWRLTVGVAILFVLRLALVIAWRALGVYGTASFGLLALFSVASAAQLYAFDTWSIQMTLLATISLYLGTGMSWSGIMHRLSRQVQSVSIAQARSPL